MSTRPKTVHGARVLVYVNGVLFGRCAGFSWNGTSPRRKIHVVDTPHAVELAATTVDCAWNMTVLRTVGDGGIQGAGMVAPQQALLSREKYFTVLLVERMSGLPLFQADMCQVEAEGWVLTPKNLLMGQIQGAGIVWVNEAAK
jgi:hypothetical protein